MHGAKEVGQKTPACFISRPFCLGLFSFQRAQTTSYINQPQHEHRTCHRFALCGREAGRQVRIVRGVTTSRRDVTAVTPRVLCSPSDSRVIAFSLIYLSPARLQLTTAFSPLKHSIDASISAIAVFLSMCVFLKLDKV